EKNYTCEELYHTVAMTEAGLPVLNPMWDDMSIPYSIKKEVTPTYILGFAACATGEISLNVDDTDIDSFFRENELQIVMENPNITSVRVIRVNRAIDKLQETLYMDRHKWYNDQKDQWVNSIVTRYQLARSSCKTNNSNHLLYEQTGLHMPALGLGTGFYGEQNVPYGTYPECGAEPSGCGPNTQKAVYTWLSKADGLRLDCANSYYNQRSVAQGI
ncbi:unnamed protein product, partial [Adineta steineri]